MNRRLVGRLATWHFAATPRARANLLGEGVAEERILVTGNTVIDALRWASTLDVPWRDHALDDLDTDPRRVLVVTAHRRESWGRGIADIADAIGCLARERQDLRVVWSLHPNPAVRAEIVPRVGGLANVTLTDPLEYAEFARLLRRAYLVCTDSGGVQEEAPALGVPVLVTRATTERPEAIEAGVARLVGTDPVRIVAAIRRLLDDDGAHRAMATVANPFGDGLAAPRIVAALAHELAGAPAPEPFAPAILAAT
jgi:UDP-N-acetylglucosamine 2-epimerase (non-hydrolysing)